MKDYILKSVVVHKDKTASGRDYMWAIGDLNVLGGNRYQNVEFNSYTIIKEENITPWLKCARQDTAYVPPTTHPGRTRWIVDENLVAQAISTGKFADGTPCTEQAYEKRDGMWTAVTRPMIFNIIENVEPFFVQLQGELAGTWVRMATQQTTVQTTNGPVTVMPGQPIPAKNGLYVPVSQIKVNCICWPELNPDGTPNPIEDRFEKARRILETRYINIGATAPQQLDIPQQPAPATQTPPEVQLQQQQQQQQQQQALYGNQPGPGAPVPPNMQTPF